MGLTSAGPVRTTYTSNSGGSAGGYGGAYGNTYAAGGQGVSMRSNVGTPGVNTSGASFRTSGGSGYGQNYNVQQGTSICDDSYIKSTSGSAISEKINSTPADGGHLPGPTGRVYPSRSGPVQPRLQPVQPGPGP